MCQYVRVQREAQTKQNWPKEQKGGLSESHAIGMHRHVNLVRLVGLACWFGFFALRLKIHKNTFVITVVTLFSNVCDIHAQIPLSIPHFFLTQVWHGFLRIL